MYGLIVYIVTISCSMFVEEHCMHVHVQVHVLFHSTYNYRVSHNQVKLLCI